MAIFFALITLIGWGVGDLFIAIVARKIGSLYANFWEMVVSIILISFYIPFAGSINDIPLFFLAGGLGFILAFGTLFYFKALVIGNASIIGAIGGAFSVPVVLMSIIFFGDKLTVIQIAAISLIVAGIVLTSIKSEKGKRGGFKEIFMAIILWSIFYTFIRVPVAKIGWFWSFYPANFFFLILLLAGKIKKDALLVFKDKQTVFLIFIFAFIISIAQFGYNLGITYGYTAIVAPVASAYPVLFVILTRIFFKEKLTKLQTAGVTLTLFAIVLLGMSNV